MAMYGWSKENGKVVERQSEQGYMEFRLAGETRDEADGEPRHSSKMLPEVRAVLQDLAGETGLRDPTEKEIKES